MDKGEKKKAKIAPDDVMTQYLLLLREMILDGRLLARNKDADLKQIEDLFDALHNIPNRLLAWNPENERLIMRDIEHYSNKYGYNYGKRLEWIVERMKNA